MKQHTLSSYGKTGLFLVVLLFAGVCAGGLLVAPQVSQAQSGPPPEAVAACEGQQQGDACSFTAPGGATIEGTCQLVQEVLACVPEDAPTATATGSAAPTATPTGTAPAPSATPSTTSSSYTIVDTGQSECYDDAGASACPAAGQAYAGQDAQYDGVQPSYVDNGDGTVMDLNTGLTWQQTPGDKMTHAEALAGAESLNLGGYDDWRLPTIKELYSLIDFRGNTGMTVETSVPYIDIDYFDFSYGDESAGERLIDAQYWSSTVYVGTVFGDRTAAFGVNFADGRIKGYPIEQPDGGSMAEMAQFVRYVRGNPDYGVNDLVSNQDGTVTDQATGLMWQQVDDGVTRNWKEALGYCEGLSLAGYDDWRLPNAKELQSIVDYTRAPDAQDAAQRGPALDPALSVTETESWFWSSTTHVEHNRGISGAYVAFGQAYGVYSDPSGEETLVNVHGAGAQRSDPKSGDPADWAGGQGPQNDEIRIYNYARCVRDAGTSSPSPPPELSYSVHLPLVANGVESSSNPSPPDPPDDASGYNLFAPTRSTTTYLTDEDGDVVYSWPSDYTPGNAVYLLENGNLLRTGNTGSQHFDAGGAGGIVEEIAPDGTVVWSFQYDDAQVRLHHDVEPLPNGNVLMIAWEQKSEAEAIAAGRDPQLIKDGELWPDHVIELDPGNNRVVWEWHVWDHLVQDQDPAQDNYGVVGEHPELIDVNYSTGAPPGGADWTHINAIDYNAELDQILLSVRNFSEIWVIDHATSSAEAAGAAGDLLYRWGNPQAYDAGGAADQQLFVQHDAQWIPDGYPGGGNILVFNNGTGRTDGDYSSVDEIVPPVDRSGQYALAAGEAYGPAAVTWRYTDPANFYADRISGAQRLADGNTLICDGPAGTFFEVTAEQEVVWTYEAGGAVFRVSRYEADYAGLPVEE